MNNVRTGPWDQSTSVDRFDCFSVAEWQDKPIPAMKWVVQDIMPAGQVVMISGDGGLGKSLIVQQLMTAASLGEKWLGFRPERVRSLGIFCEDSKDILQRRQADINRHYGCQFGDIGEDVFMQTRINQLSYLCDFDHRADTMKATPLWNQIENKVRELGIQILALDTVRKVFGGNEIRDRQVSLFIAMLRRLAIEMQGVVILTAHPSNEGVTSGSGLAGTRAWNNDVRARLYLTKGSGDNQDLRVLKTMKSNYSKSGGKVDLKWNSGVFQTFEDIPLRDFSEPTSTD